MYSQAGIVNTRTLCDQKVSVGCGIGSLMAAMMSSLPSFRSILLSRTSSRDIHLHSSHQKTGASLSKLQDMVLSKLPLTMRKHRLWHR